MSTESNIDAKFESIRQSGRTAKEAAAVVVSDGLDFAQTVQMLRRVFKLNFGDAKEAWLQANEIAASLDEYQRDLIPVVDEALAEVNKDS